MTNRLALIIGVVIVSSLMASCARQPATADTPKLTFVIDNVANEEWSHYDDGSFDVYHTVTARVTGPAEFRGRLIKVQLNAVAATDKEATVGTQWSVALPRGKPDDAQLQSLVYLHLTRHSRGS